MTYRDTFIALRKVFNQRSNSIALNDDGLVASNYWFESASWTILPGRSRYRCEAHDISFEANPAVRPIEFARERLDEADDDIIENRRFRYTIFHQETASVSGGAIILFHGLNERDWSKYLPWAQTLVKRTGRAVILFPIAFHMNRAPSEWGRPHLMRHVSQARAEASPTIANSTFANAAISARLEAMPERFCWSGLQTYYDIVQLVGEIRGGRHPLISATAAIDFFGYSIGAFLAEILLMANPEDRFSNTRLFTFCGGATVDRTYPNSRYILDSDATIALYSFFLARFDRELLANERLAHYMSAEHTEGQYFRAMLNYQDMKERREARFSELSDRVAAVALRRDTVIPATEVLNTLTGDFRDIDIRVDVTDFPYEYSHVVPFPLSAPEADVRRCFDDVFSRAAEHLH
ncbi:MAG: DUF6051 family protein [Bacteroidota bacterium]